MMLKRSFSTLLRSTEEEVEEAERNEISSSSKTISSLDQKHVWHPYAPIPNSVPSFPVKSASGVKIELVDGRTLIDGMSSWWACIHRYNHPQLNAAAQIQIQNMSHIMFGGLTHPPAVHLAQKLAEITSLEHVFFCDSGSVSVEVAMKMALQYWYTLEEKKKHKFLTIKGGYHGDTFQAMSVCDPINGMHHMFSNTVQQQLFAERPIIPFHAATWDEGDISSLKTMLSEHKDETAAIILEPIVQGAGGMNFYHPQYLKRVRELCDEYNVLLIVDEIATGFGRTGKLFACEHANITPDIMCVGKALSGGFLSFAATLTTSHVSEVFNNNNSKNSGSNNVLMHGPTFMGNPLACAVSLESINLLQSYDWQSKVKEIEYQLKTELEPCRLSPEVQDVRVLGAIGVIEMKEPMDMKVIQPKIVNDYGVWLRPFGKLLYTMPPFITQSKELRQITNAMVSIATRRRVR